MRQPAYPHGRIRRRRIPDTTNIGYTPAEYASELEIYAKSLQGTYGQDNLPFFHAMPAASLVEGITTPSIPGAKSITFAEWPTTLKDMAIEMAKFAQ